METTEKKPNREKLLFLITIGLSLFLVLMASMLSDAKTALGDMCIQYCDQAALQPDYNGTAQLGACHCTGQLPLAQRIGKTKIPMPGFNP